MSKWATDALGWLVITSGRNGEWRRPRTIATDGTNSKNVIGEKCSQLGGWRNAFNARIDRQSLRCGSTPHTLETVINGKRKRNQFLPFTAMGLYFIISSLAAAAIHVVYLRVPPAVRVIAEADHSMRKRTLHTVGAHPHTHSAQCLLSLRFSSSTPICFSFSFISSCHSLCV